MNTQALQIALMGPQAAQAQRQFGNRQMLEGTSGEPVGHWTQALNRALQGAVGGLRESQVRDQEQQAATLSRDALAKALGGGSLEDSATMLMGNPATQDLGTQLALQSISDRRSQQQAANAPPKLMNVGGRLVSVGPDGKYKVELDAAPESGRFVNVDGAGYMIGQDGQPKLVIPKQPSLAERLLQGGGGQQPTPGPQSGFLQQSNPLAPGGDPNLQLTADGAPQGQPQPDMVQIQGFPPMQRSQAEKLRSAFALEGNKAGVEVMDRALMPPETQIGESGSNEVDKQLINSGNALTRLAEIQRQFKPEYQTFETKFGMAWNELKDSFQATRGSIDPQTRAQMQEYRKFRLSAIDNINRYIKEITGAQMSEAEATRLRQGAPDAGDSLFSGDGPTTFKAKMDQTIRTMALAQMRFHYLKKNGFGGSGEQAAGLMSLQQMENKVEERTQQLLQDATARGVPQQEALPMIKQQLQSEFGMAI